MSGLRHGDNGLQLRKMQRKPESPRDISDSVDWNDPTVVKFVKLLTQALTESSSLCTMFGQMLHSSYASGLVVLAVGSASTEVFRGPIENASNGHGAQALIYFSPNPGHEGTVMVGGKQGHSHEADEDLAAGLVHELFHGWEIQTGHYSPANNNYLSEVRAVGFENAFRAQAGMPSRDCYFICGSNTGKVSVDDANARKAM
jgi:hypothetical protein